MIIFYLIDNATKQEPCGTQYHLPLPYRKTTTITPKIIAWCNMVERFTGKKYTIKARIK